MGKKRKNSNDSPAPSSNSGSNKKAKNDGVVSTADIEDSSTIPGIEGNGTQHESKEITLKGKAEDIKTWLSLAEEASKAPLKKARDLYETILQKFPLAERYWIKYCEIEKSNKNYDRVDNILKRSLITLSGGKLWLFYVLYIKERKLGRGSAAEKDPNIEKVARKEVEDAFEFALQHIGYTFDCGKIWQEYIKFIQSQKCNSQYDLGNRAQAIRKAYHRAVRVPVEHLEDIWKGFEEFEQGEKNIPQEVIQEYMKAKTVYLERKTNFNSVISGGIPQPYVQDSNDDKKIAKWRKIIDYEKGNPERTTDVELKKRMRHIYSKTLSSLFFYPEIWYEFALYELESSDPISAKSILARALAALPDCLLLHFAVADMNETLGRVDEAREIYKKLEAKNPSSIVFIQFQQFERRTSGVAAARSVFRRARQAPTGCDSTVFAAAAMLEFHNNKDHQVARNVFELGMKRFPREVGYIMHYLRFLEHLNQDSDLVTVYERVLAQLEPKEAFPIWERYREFCSRFIQNGGNLKKLAEVEKRIAELYPERQSYLSGFPGIVHRYAFLGQYPSRPSDIAFFNRAKSLSLGPHARTQAHNVGSIEGVDSATSSSKSNRMLGFKPIGADISSTPASIRKLETLLPEALGDDVRPFPVDFILKQLKSFKMPPKSILSKKKKRKVIDNEVGDSVDVFQKRRRK